MAPPSHGVLQDMSWKDVEAIVNKPGEKRSTRFAKLPDN